MLARASLSLLAVGVVEVQVRGGALAAEFDHAVGPALRQERREVYAHLPERREVVARPLVVLPADFLLALGVAAALLAVGGPLRVLRAQVRLLPLLRQFEFRLH